jgi:ABC-type lipoprotein release transport system permease subunit
MALSGIVSRYVEGWNARDPIAFLAVVFVLLFVAVAACWLPVRRATSIQPMRALRHD